MKLPDVNSVDWFRILGYNFLYHFNPYSNKNYCIYRHDYSWYWNKKCSSYQPDIGCTDGDTMQEAQIKMYQRINSLIEDGIIGHHTLVKLANEDNSNISW
jgi:hypothetical protein